jgi:hypothetical protein
LACRRCKEQATRPFADSKKNASGQVDAFGRLVCATQRWRTGSPFSVLRDASLAQDAVQEVICVHSEVTNAA